MIGIAETSRVVRPAAESALLLWHFVALIRWGTVTANDQFFQQQKPAAVLKHSVLAEYCSVFTSMTGSAYGSTVWIIDGYAGPGAYEADADGGPRVDGSPLVAMREAQRWRARGSSRELCGVFIESDRGKAAELRSNLAPFQAEGLTAVILEGTVEQRLPEAWAHVGSSPVVTFLDPFGVAMPRDLMTSLLLDVQRKAPSEVLLNINVEAVRRLGGCLELRDGDLMPKVGLERGVERVDRFFGGMSWRQLFYEAQTADVGTAASAAEAVIEQYWRRVQQLTGYQSLSVPIRRTPSAPALFHLTLFFRHPVAGYKFADAAARATRKWREVYWNQYWDRKIDESTPSLFGPEEDAAMTAAEAARREAQLADQWVTTVGGNIARLVSQRQSISVRENVLGILGSTLSFAGEAHIRKAWDALARDGVVEERNTKKRLDELVIVAKH